MGAKVPKSDHFGKTFCLVLGWLEVAYSAIYPNSPVWIWEADETTGRLVLLGSPDLCEQFQTEATAIIGACPDPADDWRKIYA